jgi:hypothetical protein
VACGRIVVFKRSNVSNLSKLPLQESKQFEMDPIILSLIVGGCILGVGFVIGIIVVLSRFYSGYNGGPVAYNSGPYVYGGGVHVVPSTTIVYDSGYHGYDFGGDFGHHHHHHHDHGGSDYGGGDYGGGDSGGDYGGDGGGISGTSLFS